MSLSGLILCLKISRPIVQLLLRPNVQRNVHGEDRKQSMLLQVVSGLENMQCCIGLSLYTEFYKVQF